MHTPELERETMETACHSGMIDMYGWLIPAIDGFGPEINLPIVSLMREMVISALKLKKTAPPGLKRWSSCTISTNTECLWNR